jgi:hypothetical protein
MPDGDVACGSGVVQIVGAASDIMASSSFRLGTESGMISVG